jgi:hypothetical protein
MHARADSRSSGSPELFGLRIRSRARGSFCPLGRPFKPGVGGCSECLRDDDRRRTGRCLDLHDRPCHRHPGELCVLDDQRGHQRADRHRQHSGQAAQTLSTLLTYPADAGTSMYFDYLAGKPLEIQALTGAIVAAGARYAIETPPQSRASHFATSDYRPPLNGRNGAGRDGRGVVSGNPLRSVFPVRERPLSSPEPPFPTGAI